MGGMSSKNVEDSNEISHRQHEEEEFYLEMKEEETDEKSQKSQEDISLESIRIQVTCQSLELFATPAPRTDA